MSKKIDKYKKLLKAFPIILILLLIAVAKIYDQPIHAGDLYILESSLPKNVINFLYSRAAVVGETEYKAICHDDRYERPNGEDVFIEQNEITTAYLSYFTTRIIGITVKKQLPRLYIKEPEFYKGFYMLPGYDYGDINPNYYIFYFTDRKCTFEKL